MEIFNYIKAANFFPEFCPSVKGWKDKMRGKNTRGTPVEFSHEDHISIALGIANLNLKVFNYINKIKLNHEQQRQKNISASDR